MILLSLRMIADLVPIDVRSLKKIKRCLVRLVGFHDPPPAYGELQRIPELAYPCIGAMVRVLDAYHPFELAPSDMDRPGMDEEPASTVLAGSIFIDLVLALFWEVKDFIMLPSMVLKQLLECLVIIIYKHDLDSKTLIHLRSSVHRAVKCVLALVISDHSYQIRQLALTVCHEFIKRFPLPRYYDFIW
jgi:hypothetical protein